MGKQSRRPGRRGRAPRGERNVSLETFHAFSPSTVDSFGLVTAEWHSFMRGALGNECCVECGGVRGCSWCEAGVEHCDGFLAEHQDGAEACTATVCVGEVEHPSGGNCVLMVPPCTRCAS